MDIYLSARINSETFGIALRINRMPMTKKINLPIIFGVGKPQIEPKTFGLSMEYGEPSNYSVTKDVLES